MSLVDELSEYQLDALKEHLNIGIGTAASILNQMLEKRIHLEVPKLTIMSLEDFVGSQEIAQDTTYATVTMPFLGSVSGSSSVVFTKESAAKLVEMMIPESKTLTTELNEITEGTLSEVGNIIINAVMGSMANLCQMNFQYLLPSYAESNLKDVILGGKHKTIGEDRRSIVLYCDTYFVVDSAKISGRILIAFLVSDLKVLMSRWTEDAA